MVSDCKSKANGLHCKQHFLNDKDVMDGLPNGCLRKTLNALVPWTRLLDALEIAVPLPVLPARIRCPLCGHEWMNITTDDGLAGGEWFHCPKCRKSGDMIELAAKVRKLSIKGTILRLAQCGFDLPTDPESVHGYLVEHANYRKRLNRLWLQAQPYLYQHSTTLRSLLSELSLPDTFPLDRWNAGPAKFLGGERRQVIEETFSPGSMRTAESSQTAVCTSSARTLKGGNWQEAMVMPFYAAPGRICAFGFIGRRRDMTTNYAFRCARVTVASPPRHHEAGVAMHPDVHEAAIDWQHTIFAVSDPLVYLHLQLGQFQHSNLPLPLVLWQDSPGGKPHVRTRLAWEMFRTCRVVFWDPSLSLPTLRQAIAIDGQIATCGPHCNEEEKLRDYLWRSMPNALCCQLQKQARPWPKALARAMLKWTDSHIEDVFLQLQLDAMQLEKVRKACPAELRARFDTILQSRQIRGNVHFDNYIVGERDDGWYYCRSRGQDRRQTLICNAKLRLSQIVIYKHTDRVFYAGTIVFNNEEIPFVAPYHEMERNPFRWLQQFLLQQNKGILRYQPSWNSRFMRVATFLKEPKILQGLDVVGWDQDKLAFLLPGRSIGLDGVRKLPVCEDISTLPAANLRYTTDLSSTNWNELGDEYTLGLFWGALAGVLSNVLAPIMLQETRGFGLVGKGAQEMGLAVAKEAGCLVCEIQTLKSVRVASELEQRHHWPLCVTILPRITAAAWRQWIKSEQTYARNCVMPMDEETAAEKEEGDRWHLLRGSEPSTMNAKLLRLVRRIVPLYLRDVCQRRLKVEDVLKDLAGFIGRYGGVVDLQKVREVLCHGRNGQEETPRKGEMGLATRPRDAGVVQSTAIASKLPPPRHAAEACREGTTGRWHG